MFSSRIIRRGRSSLAVSSTAKRCNAVGLGRVATAGQQRSPPGGAGGAAAAQEARRWQNALCRPAAIEHMKECSPLRPRVGCIAGLMPEKELASLAHVQQPRTSGAVVPAIVREPLSDGAVQQFLRRAIAAGSHSVRGRSLHESKAIIRPGRRFFSTEKENADTNSGGDNVSTESVRELPESSSAQAAAAAAAETAEAAEAATERKTTKQPKARAPRKRRTIKGERNSSSPPPAAAGTVAEERLAEEPAGESTGASKSKPPPVEIAAGRKAAFERARLAGVARRAKEGGGVGPEATSSTNSTSNTSSSGSSSSGGGGGGGDGSDGGGVSGASTFQWQEAVTSSQFTWKELSGPALPEGFPSGSGTDGRESGAVASAEATASSANAKKVKVPHLCRYYDRLVW